MSILREKVNFENQSFIADIMYLPIFPKPINGELSSEEFLASSRNVVRILDYFGNIFMPVKYDMQGNIDKLSKKFNQNKKKYSTLQKMIIDEKDKLEDSVVIDAILWLRRALHMIQLFFEYIVYDFNSGKKSEDLMANICKSYELSLEPYHGYMAQQLFNLLSRMIPPRNKVLQAIANGYDVKQEIIIKSMDSFSKRLQENITILKLFYEKHDLESYEKA
ncbi:glycolipid transfer protein A isoform X2 [Nasonia vitripennis]|uniref:Glycolipid transfer protein domain-containing protein n=1 Tax=Nasonia vitripennis TaxID=7425 RepID=A0A7M7H3Q8_NASVI|nr:glycolipid transfer protein A isoform X2 [Nasonia vitripennis]